MVLLLHRLSALKVSKITEPGYYADGDGLYLQVTAGNGGPSKSWLFRYSLNQKRREMGLGALATYSLAEARDLAKICRQSVNQGVDPIDARNAMRAKTALDAAQSVTFRFCAEKYIASHKAAWKNKKHGAQWTATLESYAYPVIGDLPVQSVETGHISDILEPIWSTKAETAGRVRGRVEVILDWAKVRGFRTGDNPARWRGHLDKLFPPRSRVRKVKHHAALPFAELPAFMALLRDENGVAARALEFLILTAARTSEVLEMSHAEIKEGVWIVDASRMKAGREHRVPLCARALEIIAEMKRLHTGPYVFPGLKLNKPLSNMALLVLLDRMGRDDLTTHGFRSTFRDWTAETTDYTNELTEMALAHVVDDKVEAAYRRGDLFNKRIRLMTDWAAFALRRRGKRRL